MMQKLSAAIFSLNLYGAKFSIGTEDHDIQTFLS